MKRCFALLLLAGCASTASLTPGVRVDEAGLQKTLFVKLPDRIFSMSPLPDGTYELITAGGRRLVDATGAVIGSDDMSAKSIYRAFLQSRGEFAVGNILGDARAEAVAGDRRAVRVYDHDSGTLLRTFELGEYVTALAVADAEIIAFTYPTPDRQGAFRILNGEGRELARWQAQPESTFGLVDGKILTVDGSGFTLQTTRGERVQHFAVSGGEKFRRPIGTRLADGRWLFVAAGSGYVPHSMVAVFSSHGALLYQEMVDGRAYATLHRDPATFLLSIENTAWTYTFTGDGPKRHSVFDGRDRAPEDPPK